MVRGANWLFVAGCLFLVFTPTAVPAQPQSVPPLAVRPLDKAAYVRLAREWKEYMEKHGETAEALVNLGRAYRYSGEKEAALRAAKRAVEISRDEPKALVFLAELLSIYEHDEDAALELLERSRRLAPDYERGLTMLAAVYLRRGDLDKADGVLRTLFDRRLVPRPLQDYAYNMLVGLPKGAVLITNGDNDTFPALALQAGMGFREDVVVLNRNLLDLESYAEAVFERNPAIRPEGGIAARGDQSLSDAVIRGLVREHKAPVYVAVTVDIRDLNEEVRGLLPEHLEIEGLSWPCSGRNLGPEESARLFLEKYRMDSATDWIFPWELFPTARRLARNYVVSLMKIAEGDNLRAETRRALLAKAKEIAQFHRMEALEQRIGMIEDK